MRGPGWHCGTRGLGALRGAWARDAALGSGLGGEPQPGAGSPGRASRGSPGARLEPEGGRWSKRGGLGGEPQPSPVGGGRCTEGGGESGEVPAVVTGSSSQVPGAGPRRRRPASSTAAGASSGRRANACQRGVGGRAAN